MLSPLKRIIEAAILLPAQPLVIHDAKVFRASQMGIGPIEVNRVMIFYIGCLGAWGEGGH